ncbi:MAG: hypothetical protein K6F52_06185 [Clostridia bacterium]|nr:hypothetical protein [Clostridia bacterium]
MNIIKKAGIITGAVVGGVLGGTLSIVGKTTGLKTVDDIGKSIVESTILTGTIAGGIASGATDIVRGAVTHDPEVRQEGTQDLKKQGKQIFSNVTGNVRLTARNAAEIGKGIVTLDGKRVVKGSKTFVKFAAVGLMTVGAIKMADSEQESEEKRGK